MQRLIDANALKQDVRRNLPEGTDEFGDIQVEVAERSFLSMIDRQPTVETEPRWISVTERLPEKNTDVMIYNTEGYIGSDFFTKDGEWFWNEEFPPTHWMPLPQPPKGE